ncbi:hypothetical protein RF11_03524 [Thelohanellus kitauei]|uniref:Uncharacterized protein n=1 Tax=Thelohanellus kitauei TaxID=669202 RepID=A0A0C2MQX2_THEKT|nr:hypothetical protein RF11_03524 [Thelohanellus kitauei]
MHISWVSCALRVTEFPDRLLKSALKNLESRKLQSNLTLVKVNDYLNKRMAHLSRSKDDLLSSHKGRNLFNTTIRSNLTQMSLNCKFATVYTPLHMAKLNSLSHHEHAIWNLDAQWLPF